jgi:hypothetical protein
LQQNWNLFFPSFFICGGGVKWMKEGKNREIKRTTIKKWCRLAPKSRTHVKVIEEKWGDPPTVEENYSFMNESIFSSFTNVLCHKVIVAFVVCLTMLFLLLLFYYYLVAWAEFSVGVVKLCIQNLNSIYLCVMNLLLIF